MKSLTNIWRSVCRDAAAFFPYLLSFYACALLLAKLLPAARSYFYWPAFTAAIIIFGGLTMVHLATRTSSIAAAGREVRALLMVPAGRAWRWLRRQTAGGIARALVAAALLGWAIAARADVVSVLLLTFGIAVVLLDAVPERVPPLLTAAFIIATPVALAFGADRLSHLLAVYAFELFAITVFGLACGVFSNDKATIH